MEQYSNAAALEELGYAETMTGLDAGKVAAWLKSNDPATQLAFPNVARELVAWIASGRKQTLEELTEKLWRENVYSQCGTIAGVELKRLIGGVKKALMKRLFYFQNP